jgi:hypothetical protein
LRGDDGLHALVEQNSGLIHSSYRSRTQATEILSYICIDLKEKILDLCKHSPFVAIEVDESTDCTKKTQLSICIRFLERETVREKFLELVHLQEANASIIFDLIVKCLKKYELLHKLVAIATDGAPVMSSKQNGVQGKFLSLKPGIVGFHCMAHKLALVMKDVADNLTKVKTLHEFVYSLISFMRDSNKRLGLFHDVQWEKDEETLNLIQPFDIRWFSHYDAIKRIYDLYPLICDTLKIMGTEWKNSMATGFLIKLQKLSTYLMLASYLDVIQVLYKVSKNLQRNSLTLNDAIIAVETAKESLRLMINSPGFEGSMLANTYQKFLNVQSMSFIDGSDKLEEERILKEKSDAEGLAKDCSELVIESLDKRFEDYSVLRSFRVLDLNLIRNLHQREIATFGNDEMKEICKRMDRILIEKQHGKLDETMLLREWQDFKILVRNNLLALNDNQLINYVFNAIGYSTIKTVYEYYLTLPVTTVECERVFSKMNIIKTSLRNSLSQENLDGLMTISLNGMPMKEQDFSTSIERWRTAVSRRKLF